jgi:hypothetical protein
MQKLIPTDQYTVEPSWHQEGDKYFPCVAIAFKQKREGADRWYRILTDRGEYRNADAAQRVADEVEIEAVYDNGLVVFTPPVA